MEWNDTIRQAVEAAWDKAYALLLELAQIPAPSNHEEKRAAFCKNWLEQQGARGVYIDDALNVVYPIGCDQDKPIVVYMAHSDVVFPDTEPLPLSVRDGRIYCPGIGDDTASAAALLMVAQYVAQHDLQPHGHGVLLVINAGEEGLGNLKGVRKIMADYGSRVTELISFDANIGSGVDRAVGSRRYRVSVDTKGGHSYGNFGNPNAIATLAAIIDDLYAVTVPPYGRTTYNVGTISGGTSVNTIAPHAEMLYEYRSDEQQSLEIMERIFRDTLEAHRSDDLQIAVECVGDRPGSGPMDPDRMAALRARVNEVHQRHFGAPVSFGSGSTDCNIPLSIGVPAVCVGCCTGEGAHTRSEWVAIDSLLPGLLFCHDLILAHFTEPDAR